MFITIDDYASVCEAGELTVLHNADPAIRQRAQQAALEEVAGYLRSRYDMASAYAAEGDARNPHLVLVVVNIALYYLTQRLPMKMAGTKRADLYHEAIDWLKMAGAGKTAPDLPPLQVTGGTGAAAGTTGGGFPLVCGSIPPQKYDW